MTPVDDLVAWLTQVWDEQEKAARDRWTMNPLAPPIEVQYGGGINPDMVTVSAPGSRLTRTMTPEEYQRTYLLPAPDERALARIAADRQILAQRERYRAELSKSSADPARQMNIPILVNVILALDETVKIAGSAYADRPGYQEAWKP